ncbi:hypothetical protein [Pseudoalteromonas nigrifaciens]|uniref:hypothetical protein n=1 Tax=Pseudoalteromonas nigrifaciens TaxID=28109 RepID=UPI003FD28B07
MSDAIFDENPSPIDKHVLNYLELLGAALRNYRKNHPTAGCRSTERYAELKLSPYFSKGVTRKTLWAAEMGKPTVSMGVYAASIQEMGLWPEIINAVGSSKADDIRYVEIVINELRKKEQLKQQERIKSLNEKFFTYIG